MSNVEEAQIGPVPPRIFKRNSHGLLIDVEYIFTPEGLVDYRKMLKPEHLVPNSAKTEETDITKIPDENLIILLSGIKYLAFLRGFSSVTYKSMAAHPSYVATQCAIKWIPNYETLNSEIIFESMADASKDNTEGFANIYLATIAENRAFARAVRNFLRINIVSKEEIKTEDTNKVEVSPDISTDPYPKLKEMMEKGSVTFTILKDKLTSEGVEEAKDWNSVEDISKPVVFELIGRITKKLQEKEAKSKSKT